MFRIVYSYYLQRSTSTNIDQVVPQAEHLELAVEVAEYYDFFEDDLPVLHWLDVYYWMELEPPAVSWNQSSRVAVNGYLNETFNIRI